MCMRYTWFRSHCSVTNCAMVSLAYWLIFATDVSSRLLKLYRSFVIGDVYYNIGCVL